MKLGYELSGNNIIQTMQLCRLTQDSRSVTLLTFPIHQQAQCQAYCLGFFP